MAAAGDSFKSSVSRRGVGSAANVGRRGATAAHVGGHRGASLERAARGEAAVEHGVSRDVQRARIRHAARHAHPGGARHPARPPGGGAGGAVTAAEASWSRNTSMDVVTPLNMMAARRSDRRTTDEDLDNPLWFEQGAWCNSREPSFMKAKKLTDFAAADVAAASAAPAQDTFNADAPPPRPKVRRGSNVSLMSAKTGISAAPSSTLTEGREVTTHLLLRSLADRIERRSCGDDGGDAPLQPLGARRTIFSRSRRWRVAGASFGRGGKSPLHCRRTDMSDRPVSSSGATRGRRQRRRCRVTTASTTEGRSSLAQGPCRSLPRRSISQPPPPPAGARRWCAVPVIHHAVHPASLLGRSRLGRLARRRRPRPSPRGGSVSLRADEWPAALRHPALVSVSALLFVLHVALFLGRQSHRQRSARVETGPSRSPTPARALCGSISPSSAPSSARRGATRARRSRCCSRRVTCSCSLRSSRRRQRWSRAVCGWV